MSLVCGLPWGLPICLLTAELYAKLGRGGLLRGSPVRILTFPSLPLRIRLSPGKHAYLEGNLQVDRLSYPADVGLTKVSGNTDLGGF